VSNDLFDVASLVFVVLFAVTLLVDEQIQGAMEGYRLNFYTHYGSNVSPEALQVFDALEVVFAVIFTLEVTLKILGVGWPYFKRPDEVFDLFVVVVSDAALVMGFINLPFNLSMLRLLRCVRLLRLVRLIRRFQGFDALHLMVTALSQSLWALLWIIVMLVLI
jgi:hypothetical protein